MRFAAGLHDIGKLIIPERIINKPGPLDPDEWQVMRQHPELGFNILRGSDNEVVKVAANVVLRHHECWDGSGYPGGLAGEAISREARIVGICDAYHALRETRPYRAGMSHDTVMGMILEGDASGRLHPGKFDPAVLAAFRASGDAVRAAFEASA
jgi:putative two-component system response regulator